MLRSITASLTASLALALLSAGCGARGGPSTGDYTAGGVPLPATAPARLRAVTFNIYNRPWERAARMQNAIETLKRLDADVICLQEAAMGWILPGDPVEEIARALHLRYVRSWHEENLGVFRTGIAVLSRYPLLEAEYHAFARHGFWDAKGYQFVRLGLPGGVPPLQLINLHMASTSDESIRRSEWQELAGVVRKLQARGPVLVAGDFNTEPTDPALREFVAQAPGIRSLYDGWKGMEHLRSWTPDYRDSCGSEADRKAQLIDYFFAFPQAAGETDGTLSFEGGRIVLPGRAPHPSDHCPVVAEIRLPR